MTLQMPKLDPAEPPVCFLDGCEKAFESPDFPFCTRWHWYSWRKANRQAGLCACGQPPSDGFKTCGPCRQYNRESARQYKRRLRRDRLAATASNGAIIVQGRNH